MFVCVYACSSARVVLVFVCVAAEVPDYVPMSGMPWEGWTG